MEKKWWHDKVAYQIYPKSFCDSNGDGIGDLRGIISRLDYLKDLGADILWLSPVYPSPLADQGYDIADYRGIDPRFGTMEDMEELIEKARERDMYIIMDLVVNHCSDEHEWFRKACEDPYGPYGKYFYIEKLSDPVPEEVRKQRAQNENAAFSADGRELPCNWRSYFGGSVWEPLPGHEDLCYLHLFHKKQPDLNWENPALREEVYSLINWWLDKGLAGFRIDAILNLKKVLPFKNYPADRTDGLASVQNMLDEAEGLGDFLTEMKERCFAPHNSFTVGEVCSQDPEVIHQFIGEEGYFSTMFDFAADVYGSSPNGWHEAFSITPDEFKTCYFTTQKEVGDTCYISNVIENHDQGRSCSRYLPDGERTDAAKKLLGTVYFLLKGLPWIYQGQELGMENTVIRSMSEVDDISSHDNYAVALRAGLSEEEALRAVAKYSRDNARTPFQWSAEEYAGFSTAQPWLKVNPNYEKINLAAEEKDPESVYHFYRKLTRLRKDPVWQEPIVYGEVVPYLPEQKCVFSYFRKGENAQVLVIANFQKEPQAIPLPEPYAHLTGEALSESILMNNMETAEIAGGVLQAAGYQVIVLGYGKCTK